MNRFNKQHVRHGITKKYTIGRFFSILLMGFMITACGGGGGGGGGSGSSGGTLTVDAGNDQSVEEGRRVTLSGSGSDASGSVTLVWSQDSGPTVILDDNHGDGIATFTAPQIDNPTILTFTLAAISGGSIITDSVSVTITNTTVSHNLMLNPRAIVVDSASNRAFVGDIGLTTIYTVDLDNGSRSVLSSNNVPDSQVPLSSVKVMVLDSANNRLLVVSNGDVLAVDLDTGVRSVVAAYTGAFSRGPVDGVLDSSNNRLLVSDDAIGAIIAIDLESGARTMLSGDTVPDGVTPFSSPKAMSLDSGNNRILVTDRNQIIAVDLSTGARSLFSDINDPFRRPVSIVVDSANNRAIVGDTNAKAIFSVNLSTGNVTIISDNTINTENKFIRIRGVDLDLINNRVLVVDEQMNAIVSVDLNSGNRSIISATSLPDYTNPFGSGGSIVTDTLNNRLLVSDSAGSGFDRTIAVDLSSGTRTTVFTERLFSMTLDAANNRVLGFVFEGLVAVDLDTGVLTLISDRTVGNPLFANVADMTLDSANNRVLAIVNNNQTVIAIDLSTGLRSLVSDNNTPDNANPIAQAEAIVLDSANDRVLLMDVALQAIVAVSLADGSRTILTSDFEPFDEIISIALDTTNNRLLVTDSSTQAIHSVDLTDGSFSIFSSNIIPSDETPLSRPRDISIDIANNRVLVFDTDWGGVIAIDLSTGARTFLSLGIRR